ncbi:MAG: DUF169 domain-containing protein [Candidatus Bathyarchaeia archaeon]
MDLSIYNKLNFERPPVAVKFLFKKPENIQRLNKKLALCEMIREAQQENAPFYFDKENEDCFGKFMLGMAEQTGPPRLMAQIGIKYQIFQEPRANRRIQECNPTFPKGLVNYVVFSPLDKLTFNPDLLILTATPSQAEVVLRATTYSTGTLFEAKHSIVGACSWLFIHPFKSGKVNYVVTGLSFGMKAKQVFPEGLILIAIPYDWIPTVTQNLKEMKWDLPAYTMGREWHVKERNRILKELAQELQSI